MKVEDLDMKPEDINMDKLNQIIDDLSLTIDPLLVAGRKYYSEITKNKHGSTGGMMFFVEKGIKYDFKNTGDYSSDEFKAHTNSIRNTTNGGMEISSFIDLYPVHSKIRFTLEKGQKIKIERFDIPMLLEDIKTEIKESYHRNSDPENKYLRTEMLIELKIEADELGMFVDRTDYYTNKTESNNFTHVSDAITSIYYYLDEKLKRIYINIENDAIEVKTEPSFEKFGLAGIEEGNISLTDDYKKEKIAFEINVKNRYDFFNSLGKVDDRVIYLSVGGFRDFPWPEDSTSHNSSKMRVIYTKDTTILITDGLSNLYSGNSSEEQKKYCGIGLELYMEFHGKTPFEVIHKHFAMALINSVSQIALEHGNMKDLLLKHGTTTIEFKEDNINPWINRENHANHNLFSFITKDKFISRNKFGTLLGMESKNVPLKFTSNLEDVLLINIKPFDKIWLTKSKTQSSDKEKAKEARNNLVESFKSSGEWNSIPLTYQKEYITDDPSSGGTVISPFFPF